MDYLINNLSNNSESKFILTSREKFKDLQIGYIHELKAFSPKDSLNYFHEVAKAFHFEELTIQQVKKFLNSKGVSVRL